MAEVARQGFNPRCGGEVRGTGIIVVGREIGQEEFQSPMWWGSEGNPVQYQSKLFEIIYSFNPRFGGEVRATRP